MGKAEVEAAIEVLEAWGRTVDNWVLIFAAGVAISLAAEVVFSVAHWLNERQLRPLRIEQANLNTLEIAELNNETARLRAKGALVDDALLAAAEATKANALAAQFLLALSQQLSILMRPGMQMPGFLSPEQVILIASKVKTFAGKQYSEDIDIMSADVERAGLLGSIMTALNEAGWVRVVRPKRPSIDAGITIEVDTSKDPELLKAAETLSSALNAEGIAARVNPKTETDPTNVIHILIGPKP